jgi:elongation factor 1-beta
MGNVAVTLKIMPESPDIDLEKIKEDIAKKIEIKDSKVESIAFGLKALKILVVIPDKGVDELKEDLKNIDGVSEVEVETSTLI